MIDYVNPATALVEGVDDDGARRETLGESARADSGRPNHVPAVVRQLLEDGLAFVPMEPPCECKKLCNKPRKGCPRRGWRSLSRRDFTIRRVFAILTGGDYGMSAVEASRVISVESGLIVNALRKGPLHDSPVDPPSIGTIRDLWSKRPKRGDQDYWIDRAVIVAGRPIVFALLDYLEANDAATAKLRRKRACFLRNTTGANACKLPSSDKHRSCDAPYFNEF